MNSTQLRVNSAIPKASDLRTYVKHGSIVATAFPEGSSHKNCGLSVGVQGTFSRPSSRHGGELLDRKKGLPRHLGGCQTLLQSSKACGLSRQCVGTSVHRSAASSHARRHRMTKKGNLSNDHGDGNDNAAKQ